MKTLANLVMGEVITPLQCFLAALHGLDEAGFLFEMARKHVLKQLVRIAALLGRGMRQLRFEFGRKVDFHCGNLTSYRTPRHEYRRRRCISRRLTNTPAQTGGGTSLRPPTLRGPPTWPAGNRGSFGR